MLVGQPTKDGADFCAEVDTVLSVVPVFEETHPRVGSKKMMCCRRAPLGVAKTVGR